MAVVQFTSNQVFFLLLFSNLWFKDFTLDTEVLLTGGCDRVRGFAESFVRKLTCHDLTFRDIGYIGFGRADRLLDGELHTVESSKVKLRENSCNLQWNKVVCQATLIIVFLHAHFHCPQGCFMIHGELYRAIWAPFSDFGGRHWSHGTAIPVQTGHSVNSVHVHNSFALSIDRVPFRVSDFTISPVFFADDMTIGLQNIKCEIEDSPCLSMLRVMDIAEMIKA